MERSPIQVNPSPEEPEGPSSSSEVTAEAEDFEVRGSRFSKSADERQRMLMQRKEELLQRARRWAFPSAFRLRAEQHTLLYSKLCFLGQALFKQEAWWWRSLVCCRTRGGTSICRGWRLWFGDPEAQTAGGCSRETHAEADRPTSVRWAAHLHVSSKAHL